MGRGGGKGEIPDYGGGVYGDRDIDESYSLPPSRNGGDVLLIKTENLDQPEHGSQEPRWRRAGGTGGKDVAGDQKDRYEDFREIGGRGGVGRVG